MATPLNICLIASAQSIHVRRWAEFFVGRGHSLHIVGNFSASVSGTKVWNLYSKARFGELAYVLSMWRARRFLEEIRPDIVHFHYLGGSCLYESAVSRLNPRPVVVATPWGSDVYMAGWWKKALCRRLLARSDRILATSTSMMLYLQLSFGQNPEKMAAYSWGIDCRFFGPATIAERKRLRSELHLPEKAFIIFSPRAITPLYRTDLIVRAFLNARQTGQEMFLVLLEGGEARGQRLNDYRRRIRKYTIGSEAAVRIPDGFIAPEVIAKYYKTADCVISVPISDQRSASVLEAIACGAAVIMSPIPEATFMQQEGYQVIILPEVTVENIAQSLVKVSTFPSPVRQKLYAANYRLIQERENWESQAAKIEAEYLALLERRSETTKAKDPGA